MQEFLNDIERQMNAQDAIIRAAERACAEAGEDVFLDIDLDAELPPPPQLATAPVCFGMRV